MSSSLHSLSGLRPSRLSVAIRVSIPGVGVCCALRVACCMLCLVYCGVRGVLEVVCGVSGCVLRALKSGSPTTDDAKKQRGLVLREVLAFTCERPCNCGGPRSARRSAASCCGWRPRQWPLACESWNGGFLVDLGACGSDAPGQRSSGFLP